MQNQSRHCLIYGMGYSAGYCAMRLQEQGWHISGLTRDADKIAHYTSLGMRMTHTDTVDAHWVAPVTHLLVSVPPGQGQARALLRCAEWSMPHLAWIGYLSSTGVYGDCGGAWVDENSPLNPHDARTQARYDAEVDWQLLATRRRVPLHIFRLAGIYGPGRNAIRQVLDGRARRIVDSGVAFSRVHVADIAGAVALAMEKGRGEQVYNVCDDMPAEAQAVIAYACTLLGVPPPPPEPFADAELTPMMRSFYAANRQVSNAKLKADLGMKLAYPSYKEGLAALLAEEQGSRQ